MLQVAQTTTETGTVKSDAHSLLMFGVYKVDQLSLLAELAFLIIVTARPHSSVKKIFQRFFTLNGVTSLCLTFRRTALWEAEWRFSGFKS